MKNINENLIEESKELVKQLLSLPNSPINRKGFEKATYINNWLLSNGIKSRIIAVPNLDPTKEGNQNNCWYNVEATVGDTKYKGGVNGLIMTHHDTIAHQDYSLTYNNGVFSANALQDDTIHVAASLLEIRNFHQWWANTQKRKKLKGRVKLIVTDGEEVNTLGMRGLIKHWDREGDLHPFHFVLIGESTGDCDSPIPGIAYMNRGKATGKIFSKKVDLLSDTINKKIPSEGEYREWKNSPYNKIVTLLQKFKSAQESIFNCSVESKHYHSGLPELAPSTLAVTIVDANKDSLEAFWEIRTDKYCNSAKSIKLLQKSFSEDQLADNILTFNTEESIKSILHEIKVAENDSKLSITVDENDQTILKLKYGDQIHPGAYNLKEDITIYNMIELVLAVLHKEKDFTLSEVKIGDNSKPNCVPNYASIKFMESIDLNKLVSLLNGVDKIGSKNIDKKGLESKSFLKTIKNEDYKTELDSEFLFNKIQKMYVDVKSICKDCDRSFSIEPSEHVPSRDSLGNLVDNEWIVSTLSRSLKLNVKKYLDQDCNVKLTVFNAMNDNGPLSDKEYYKKVWEFGENVVTMGVGDFHRLHGDEQLTDEQFIIGSIQYIGTLRALWLQTENLFFTDEAEPDRNLLSYAQNILSSTSKLLSIVGVGVQTLFECAVWNYRSGRFASPR